MTFVDSPNLPEKPVSLVVADCRISVESETTLEEMGVKLLKIKPHPGLYEAVSSHPDMLLHHLGGNLVVYAPGTDPALLEVLADYGFSLLRGESELSPKYPADIAYNIARVGRLYFHNLKHTDPVAKKQLEKLGIEPVHVEQGYSKCAILPVNSHTIITTDAGIARVADKRGLDVLLLSGEGSICLPGLNCGFIGGAAGMIDKLVCVLNGDINKLDCSSLLSSFASKNGIILKSLSNSQVTDIGSILPLMVRESW